jgi:hypothetical protein
MSITDEIDNEIIRTGSARSALILALTENKLIKADIQRLKDANRWIPVSEALPTTTGFKLCASEFFYPDRETFRTVAIEFYNENRFYSGGKVIAWRELPEPYQGDL